MASARRARYLTLAGLAAASATAAHGGWGELSDPRWAGAAAAGAALAAAGLAWTGVVATAARWAAAELDHGRIPAIRAGAHRPLSVVEAAAVLVMAQACAHGALLAAGAPAHTGAGGALALHLALALAAALAASTVDRVVATALDRLGAAAGRLLELLLTAASHRTSHASSLPRPARFRQLPPGRAPPLPA
jgi:hypothetical protein